MGGLLSQLGGPGGIAGCTGSQQQGNGQRGQTRWMDHGGLPHVERFVGAGIDAVQGVSAQQRIGHRQGGVARVLAGDRGHAAAQSLRHSWPSAIASRSNPRRASDFAAPATAYVIIVAVVDVDSVAITPVATLDETIAALSRLVVCIT